MSATSTADAVPPVCCASGTATKAASAAAVLSAASRPSIQAEAWMPRIRARTSMNSPANAAR